MQQTHGNIVKPSFYYKQKINISIVITKPQMLCELWLSLPVPVIIENKICLSFKHKTIILILNTAGPFLL